ncbi:MAG TPA: GNAT family N-acetyltransferase [Chryseolinea sp.]|nr:GNAT family N-acetyltransferase [Chryseolinea sp.]
MDVLQTKRLNLRFYETSDADFILRLLNEPSFHRNIGDRKVRTTEDAVNYINLRLAPSYSNNGYGLYMVEKLDGTPIGMCGLVKRDPNDDPDVGFAFIPETWQQGYAFEAASAVVDYARNILKIKRILGITIPDNIASIKTLQKLGLQYLKNDVAKETNEAICVYELLL